MINTQVDVEGHIQKYTIVEVPTSFWNTQKKSLSLQHVKDDVGDLVFKQYHFCSVLLCQPLI